MANVHKIINHIIESKCETNSVDQIKAGFNSLDQIKAGKIEGFPKLVNAISQLPQSERIEVLEFLFKNPESSPLYISYLNGPQKKALANAIDPGSCTELKGLKVALTGSLDDLRSIFDNNKYSEITKEWNNSKKGSIDPQEQNIQSLLTKGNALAEQLKLFLSAYNACMPTETGSSLRGGHITQICCRVFMPLTEYNKIKESNTDKAGEALKEFFNSIENQYQTLDIHCKLDKIQKQLYGKINEQVSQLISKDLNTIIAGGNREEMKIVQHIIEQFEENSSYTITDSEKIKILKLATNLPEDVDVTKLLNKFGYNVGNVLGQITNLKGRNLTKEDMSACIKRFTEDGSTNSLTDVHDAMQMGEVLGIELNTDLIKQFRNKLIKLGKRNDINTFKQDIQRLKDEISKQEPQREIKAEDILGYMKTFLSDNRAQSLDDVYLSETLRNAMAKRRASIEGNDNNENDEW